MSVWIYCARRYKVRQYSVDVTPRRDYIFAIRWRQDGTQVSIFHWVEAASIAHQSWQVHRGSMMQLETSFAGQVLTATLDHGRSLLRLLSGGDLHLIAKEETIWCPLPKPGSRVNWSNWSHGVALSLEDEEINVEKVSIRAWSFENLSRILPILSSTLLSPLLFKLELIMRSHTLLLAIIGIILAHCIIAKEQQHPSSCYTDCLNNAAKAIGCKDASDYKCYCSKQVSVWKRVMEYV